MIQLFLVLITPMEEIYIIRLFLNWPLLFTVKDKKKIEYRSTF